MTAYEVRISDWSSDVCSSDLSFLFELCRQLCVLAEFDTRNHAAMHGVRTIRQAQHACRRIQRREREVMRQAGGAMDLDRLADQLFKHVRRDHIDCRHLGQRSMQADRSEERRVGKSVSVSVALGGRRIIKTK